MLKIGVGPSSSHTLGPWRAAERWIVELKKAELFDMVEGVAVNLYGSLSLTGIGHATDIAAIMGLLALQGAVAVTRQALAELRPLPPTPAE